MVPSLQHVHRSEQPASEQDSLDRRLGVTSQQCRETTQLQPQHDRTVIDVVLRKRRIGVGLGGIENGGDGVRAEIEPLAGACQHDRDSGARRIGHQAVVGRVLERDSGVEHGTHAVAVEDVDQARHVILVRMADHEQVDPSRKERQVRAHPP